MQASGNNRQIRKNEDVNPKESAGWALFCIVIIDNENVNIWSYLILQLFLVAKFQNNGYTIGNGGYDMGQKEKLIQRLKSKPKDFTFDDAETLLKYLDYICSNKGKTSGFRVMFVNDEHGSILLHKPHPQKELKAYQIKQLIEILEQEGLI